MVPSESHSSRPSRSRCHPEALRCIFCAFVIFGHCYLQNIEIAILAVVGFLTISTGFALNTGSPSRLLHKIRAVLVLWLWWWIPYAVLLGARGVDAGVGPFGLVRMHMLVTGPSIHLWYLPALAATYALLMIAGNGVVALLLATACAALVLVAELVPLGRGDGLPTPLPQLLVTCFSLAGTLLTARIIPGRLHARGAVAGYAAVTAGSVLVFMLPYPWLAYLLAIIGAMLLCRCDQPAPPRWLAAAASLTGGVYLVHVIPLSACRWLGFSSLECFSATLPASVVIVAIARRTALRRYF